MGDVYLLTGQASPIFFHLHGTLRSYGFSMDNKPSSSEAKLQCAKL